MSGAFTRDEGEHAGVIGKRVVITGGQGIARGEMLALEPVLELAGHIAAVLADFKGGDDNDLDLQRCRRRVGGTQRDDRPEEQGS